MTFHQLEKVLARAATNRSFRDEIANGDADLDELGLSEDEQSVLNELVASSGAGLDAVLNVVTSVPTSAVAAPRGPGVPPATAQPASNTTSGATHHNGSATSGAAATAPAFALMTPPASPQYIHTVVPDTHPATPPPAATAWQPGVPASVPTPMPATIPTGLSSPTVTPATMPMETQGPPAAGVSAAAGPAVAGMPTVMVPYVPALPGGYAMPYVQPGPVAHPAVPTALPAGTPTAAYPTGPADGRVTSPAGEASHGQHRSLDASDVGRPVVARLPFGMDVVK